MGPTVAKRLNRLCDPDTPEELFEQSGSVYFTGSATIGGRKAVIIAAEPDPPIGPADLPSSLSRYLKALRYAETEACPVIFLHDAPAPYQSGRTAFQGSHLDLMMGEEGVGRQYYEISRLSGGSPWSAVFSATWPRLRPFRRPCATGR